ncbi:MAG: hypothetical protein ACREMO_10590 [Gemmatimonadales bacterium]
MISNSRSTPLAIFPFTYPLFAVQRVSIRHLNRAAAALPGAVAMVVVGGPPLPETYAAIDPGRQARVLGIRPGRRAGDRADSRLGHAGAGVDRRLK